MQISTEQQRAAMKTATRAQIARVGGLLAAESVTRPAKSRLAQYGDRNAPDSFVPLDVALDLDLASGEPVLAAALANSLGFALIPLQIGDSDIAKALEEVSRDVCELITDTVHALSHDVPIEDALTLARDIDKTMRALMTAAGALQARIAASTGPSLKVVA